ncbi:unnamed protein product [Rotaria sp. Silwood1]|nr:unnamed protein product [Rotaria sp. Silwood1]
MFLKSYSSYTIINCTALESVATVYGVPTYLLVDGWHPCIGDHITNSYGKRKYICELILKDTIIARPIDNLLFV